MLKAWNINLSYCLKVIILFLIENNSCIKVNYYPLQIKVKVKLHFVYNILFCFWLPVGKKYITSYLILISYSLKNILT